MGKQKAKGKGPPATIEKLHAWIPAEITHPLQRRFLAAYGNVPVVTPACKAAGISRAIHYQWLKESPVYAKAVEDAKKVGNDAIEAEILRRAFAGSDLLLIFYAKAAMPEKYREHFKMEHAGGVTLEMLVAGSWEKPADPALPPAAPTEPAP